METIAIGYNKIDSQFGKGYYHKFIIYTDKNGSQTTVSGWTSAPTVESTTYLNIQIYI